MTYGIFLFLIKNHRFLRLVLPSEQFKFCNNDLFTTKKNFKSVTKLAKKY